MDGWVSISLFITLQCKYTFLLLKYNTSRTQEIPKEAHMKYNMCSEEGVLNQKICKNVTWGLPIQHCVGEGNGKGECLRHKEQQKDRNRDNQVLSTWKNSQIGPILSVFYRNVPNTWKGGDLGENIILFCGYTRKTGPSGNYKCKDEVRTMARVLKLDFYSILH